MQAIELPNDMEKMFQSVSRDTGRTLNDLVQEALGRFLEEWEDRQDAVDATRLYREFKESGEAGIPLDKLLQDVGLTRSDLV
ncbi:MAG: hypothetical protein HQL94_02805 [Magnetococcales bacterium]|nr:hypothetical protein [Magnetococcales bacterium]MBF0438799.1 hypothetical protein [Magnetococcales bacterium]